VLAALLVVAGCSSDDDSSSTETFFPTATTGVLSQLEVICSLVNEDGTCGQLELQYLCATCTTELRTTVDFADEIDPKQLLVDFDRSHFDDLLADANDGRLNVVIDDFAKSQLDTMLPKFDDAVRVLGSGVTCRKFGRIPLCVP
jgi:hypothetical protein